MKGNQLTVSNILTVFRLLLGPVIMVLVILSRNYIALGLIILAVFTDFMDGYLARKFKKKTDFGRMMDPIADKLIFAFLMFGFFIRHKIYYWIFIVVLAIIVYLLGHAHFVKQKIKATLFGKAIVLYHIVVAAAFLIDFRYKWILLWIAILLAFISGIIYLIRCYKK